MISCSLAGQAKDGRQLNLPEIFWQLSLQISGISILFGGTRGASDRQAPLKQSVF
jgi:hypothetical protein